MTDTTVAPARWYAHRAYGHPSDSDVVVAVIRSEPTDLTRITGGPLSPICYRLDPDGPGDRETPPLTVVAVRDVPVHDTRPGRTGERCHDRQIVVPLLRLSAADWDTACRPPFGEFHAGMRVPTVTDLHSGVEWIVCGWSGWQTSDPHLTADPVGRYEIRFPQPWGSTRHEDTYRVLDAVPDLAFDGWTIVGPYRQDRP